VTGRNLILVVEDNEANQMLTRAVLELEGYSVAVAGSAPEALDRLRDATPDLILMDIQLPGEDGLSLARRLKANPASSMIPVVALTAHAMTGEALHAGCVGYISKPIDTRTFGAAVGRFLQMNGDERLVAG